MSEKNYSPRLRSPIYRTQEPTIYGYTRAGIAPFDPVCSESEAAASPFLVFFIRTVHRLPECVMHLSQTCIILLVYSNNFSGFHIATVDVHKTQLDSWVELYKRVESLIQLISIMQLGDDWNRFAVELAISEQVQNPLSWVLRCETRFSSIPVITLHPRDPPPFSYMAQRHSLHPECECQWQMNVSAHGLIGFRVLSPIASSLSSVIGSFLIITALSHFRYLSCSAIGPTWTHSD